MRAINEMIEIQMAHRTIREFKDEPVSKDVMGQLLEVVNRTATSTGLQSFSIIRITDTTLRKKIALICGQDYVARAPELLIFIADVYRNARIAEEQGVQLNSAQDMDRFFQGFTDAVLAAQNLTSAVESLGMGAVFFGSILNDPDAIIRVLKLPRLTFPVLGVGFGYPTQDPQLKPRLDISLKLFENQYQVLDKYLPAIAAYDEIMRTYYDLRENGKRSDTFSQQVVKRLLNSNPKRSGILNAVLRQGFDFQIEDSEK